MKNNWLFITVTESGKTKYYSEQDVAHEGVEIEISADNSAYEVNLDKDLGSIIIRLSEHNNG